MKFLIDADGTLCVERGVPYDATTPIRWIDGALAGVAALKRAGHDLLLWSARDAPRMWMERNYPLVQLNLARQKQMHDAIERDMPGMFEVPEQRYGKPVFDKLIDDKSIPPPPSWFDIAEFFGEHWRVGDACSFFSPDGKRMRARVVTLPNVRDIAEHGGENVTYVVERNVNHATLRASLRWENILAPLP